MSRDRFWIYCDVRRDGDDKNSFVGTFSRRHVSALSCLPPLTDDFRFSLNFLCSYVPALAFAQVSGFNLHLIACLTSVICIFYTTVGGLKAVVWTDTLQFLLMVGGIVAVTILGLSATGGFWNVWETSDAGGRLIFFE